MTSLVFLILCGIPRLSTASGNNSFIESAKREGKVVFYASMNLGEANTVINEFQKHYPFVKVKLNRTGSEKLLTKVLTETRARKMFADVIQTVEFSMHLFHKNGALARYLPAANSVYPREFKEEGYWTTVYYNPYVTGYNARLVTRSMRPKSYHDLLDRKWKGKLLMEGTKADWFAGMLQIMGQERGLDFMRDLAKQQPSVREGHELLAQLVAAGEGLVDINIPAPAVDRLKEKGAPIDWIALGIAPAVMVGIGLSAQSSHPNAAKLFVDFMLSREGQKLMQGFGELVARRDLAPEQPALVRAIKMVPVDPALADKMNDYAKQFRAIFGS